MSQAAYESGAFAVGGQVVYRNDMDEASKVSGYCFELNENVPNFSWYEEAFPEKYLTNPILQPKLDKAGY